MLINKKIRCKPSKILWQSISREVKAEKKYLVVVDDSLANLKTAKIMGFKTVWMCEHLLRKENRGMSLVKRRPKYVDFKVSKLRQLISLSQKLS